MMRLEEYVARFIGDEQREIVIRENGAVKRTITDVSGFIEHLFMPDVYYSVRSVYDMLLDKWSRVVFDFDAHDGNLEEAREDALAFINYLDYNGVEVNAIFTGRGYQVVLIFDEKISLDVDRLRRELSQLEIGRMDLHILNSNPVARLPYTYNSKAGRLATPVNPYDLVSEQREIRVADSDIVLALFPEAVAIERSHEINRLDIGLGELGTNPLCIMRMITYLAIHGELDHMSRFALAIYLLREYGNEAAMRVFSKASDYREHMTMYQLNHISSRKYLFPRCDKIRELGWCDEKVRCPFRPWLEPYLRWWS